MEEEKPIKRIQLFAKIQNLSIKNFEKTAGLNPNVIQNAIARNSNMSDDTLRKLLRRFPELNMTWVLLGQGEMLLTTKTVSGQKDIMQEPDFAEVLDIVNSISDEALSPTLRDKIFQLYQANSDLKTKLLQVYQMIGNA